MGGSGEVILFIPQCINEMDGGNKSVTHIWLFFFSNFLKKTNVKLEN